MAEKKDVLEGTPMRPEAKDLQAGAQDALNALNLIVVLARDGFQTYQTESTKREYLRTLRETETARIRASQEALRDYLDRVYADRRDTHQRLFASLDQALAAGDTAAVQAVVGGIVEVARTSPLADIGNIVDLKRAMSDPSTIWEL
ncbi:hypothetical protein O7634_10690 [Micromonospora sp. WMMD1120]|uniref:hypothetical protein n=1 Tax=Micromonospora sp. WMMD1120 TaxID=3016106 RepID=UPI0024166C39|nr:hypothetical protein [Micromonospora sp. WMMD1120]MDG4807213.1 hypothetical protein [Micromonospora sp. WMMD1120]